MLHATCLSITYAHELFGSILCEIDEFGCVQIRYEKLGYAINW